MASPGEETQQANTAAIECIQLHSNCVGGSTSHLTGSGLGLWQGGSHLAEHEGLRSWKE